MQHAGHRFTGYARVAMRNRDGMIFVKAKKNSRRFIPEMVHERIVQSAKRRTGVQTDEGTTETSQHFRRNIAAPRDLRIGPALRSVDDHDPALLSTRTAGRHLPPNWLPVRLGKCRIALNHVAPFLPHL